MLEATLASMGWVVSNYLIAGQTPAQQGNENATSAPSGLFTASDAPLNIAANKDEQWQTLARLIGREDLIEVVLKGMIKDLSAVRGMKLEFSAKGNDMSNFQKLGG